MKLTLLLILCLSQTSSSNLRTIFRELSSGLPPTKARFQLFQRNVKLIRELNRGGMSWRAEVNKFAVMTEAERATYKGLNVTNRRDPSGGRTPIITSGTARKEVNWRSEGWVTPARNQWGCGSCWVLAAVAVIETRAVGAGSGKYHLSDQEIVDCGSPWRDACDGGDSLKAFEYVYDRNSLAKESDYPYIGRSQECQRDGKANGLSNVKQQYYTYRYGQDQMIEGLSSGPIVVEFNAIEPFFYHRKGIFDYPKCGTNVDHAMAAVAYTPDYILLKNSWGSDWAEEGFAKVTRAYNICGMYKWGFHPNFLPEKEE